MLVENLGRDRVKSHFDVLSRQQIILYIFRAQAKFLVLLQLLPEPVYSSAGREDRTDLFFKVNA